MNYFYIKIFLFVSALNKRKYSTSVGSTKASHRINELAKPKNLNCNNITNNYNNINRLASRKSLRDTKASKNNKNKYICKLTLVI